MNFTCKQERFKGSPQFKSIDLSSPPPSPSFDVTVGLTGQGAITKYAPNNSAKGRDGHGGDKTYEKWKDRQTRDQRDKTAKTRKKN